VARPKEEDEKGKGKKAYMRWLIVLLATVAVATALLVVAEGYGDARCWLPLLRCAEARASVFSFLFFFYSTSCCCWWRWREGATVALLG